MIRQEQVVPLFPPREDVRVGDVYLSLVPPARAERELYKRNRDEFIEIPLLLCTVGKDAQLQEYYRARPPYPLTPTNGLVSSRLVITNHSEVKGKGGVVTNTTTITEYPLLLTVPDNAEITDANIYESAAPNRLRHVAFPEFSTVQLDSGALQFVVPVKAVSVAVGGAATQAKSASLRISSGESCGLLVQQLLQDLRTELGTQTSRAVAEKYSRLFTELADNPPKQRQGTNRVCLTLISEVYYARSIDVSYELKKSMGGALAVKADEGVSLIDAAASAAARATMLNALNARVLSASAPGGSLAFTSVSDTAIGLRRTYSRPIAVGYRGLTLELVRLKNDDWTLGSASLSQAVLLNHNSSGPTDL